jgi:hypothetical protein
MTRSLWFGLTVLASITASLPLAAQQPAGSPPAPTTPADQASPHLSVATVTVQNARRVSKIIGAPVINDQNQQVGSVDDLIMSGDDKLAYAIVSVGGVLGMGGKLVAFPFDQLQIGANNKITLPGATKEKLNDMPRFTYPG